MKGPTRRALIFAGLGAGAVVVLGPVARGVFEGRIFAVLDRAVGPEFARHPEAVRFVADFLGQVRVGSALQQRLFDAGVVMRSALDRGEEDELDEIAGLAVEYFLRSTNVVRAYETGADFEYVALFDPTNSPCANQLGANWL